MPKSGFIDLDKGEKEEEIIPSLEKLKEKGDEEAKKIMDELIKLLSSREISSLIIEANTSFFGSKKELSELKKKLIAASDKINRTLLNVSEITASSLEREQIDKAKDRLLEKKSLINLALNKINIQLKKG